MKIVQTLWTGRKDLLRDEFGWIAPECHLISWALSCLKLREFYDNVVLYTDSQGKRILGDYLHLPYTKIEVVYDNLKCREAHWAYPKIVTYSLQDEPFLHVDGDVILSRPIDKNIIGAELIAQNKEIISDYYKNMVNDIMRRRTILPSYLKKDIENGSFGSYNAGLLGGSDINYIKKYCEEANKIINDNGMNDPTESNMAVNNNILFEQILFYSMVKNDKREVKTVIEHDVQDNGYSYKEFADFYLYGEYPLIHMLGGHKRNYKVCELMKKMLLKISPDLIKEINMLFKCKHIRLESKNNELSDMSIQMCVGKYLDELKQKVIKWKNIPHDLLFENEKRSSLYLDFMIDKDKYYNDYIFKCNSYIEIFLIPKEWPEEAKILIRDRIDRKKSLKPLNIAIIPLLYGNKGYSEILINDLQYNIISLSKKGVSYEDLFKYLKSCFTPEVVISDEKLRDLIKTEIEYLAYNKLLFVFRDHHMRS